MSRDDNIQAIDFLDRVIRATFAAIVFSSFALAALVAAAETHGTPQGKLAPVDAFREVPLLNAQYREVAVGSAKGYPWQSIGRVYGKDIQGPSGSQGTGAYIGAGIVLTAKHVLRGTSPNSITFTVSGKRYRAKETIFSKRADQALLKLESMPNVRPIPLAANPLKFNQFGIAYGLGGNGPSTFKGVFKDTTTKLGNAPQSSAVFVGAGLRSGDSGCPILNAAGELVATSWGSYVPGWPVEFSAIRYAETVDFLKRVGVYEEVQQACQPGQACYQGPVITSPINTYPTSPQDPNCPGNCSPSCACGCGGNTGPPPVDPVKCRDGVDGTNGVDGKTPTDAELVALIVRVTAAMDLKGEPGNDGVVDYERVREIIREEVAGLEFAIVPGRYAADGSLVADGETIQIRPFEAAILPPQILTTITIDGDSFSTMAPLGKPLTIKNAGVK